MPGRSRNPLGQYGPWAWQIEPTHGCNLRCGHCAARVMTEAPHFVEREAWASLMTIIMQVTPRCRVEMAMCGEPTLHPNIVDLAATARKLSPGSQLQITTNGTMLAKGMVTYASLFRAGVNIMYVDMYAPRERHIELARQSGYQWYEYLNAPKDAPSAWTYQGPHIKFIVLMEHPANWPKKRKGLGRLGTWLNHLDWEAAKPFGLRPVTDPIKRRCSQPYHHVAVNSRGQYVLCCQDAMGETAGTMGSVTDGIEGFKRFWFGRKMQSVRRHLRNADRAAILECSRCNVTFSRSDFRLWNDEALSKWWDGKTWVPFDDASS